MKEIKINPHEIYSSPKSPVQLIIDNLDKAKADINELLDQIAKMLLGEEVDITKICKIADKYDINFGNKYK